MTQDIHTTKHTFCGTRYLSHCRTTAGAFYAR